MTNFLENLPNLRVALTVFVVIFVDFCALMILVAAGRERRRGDQNWASEGRRYMLTERGINYPLGAAELLIGRHPSADIRLADVEISRFHALLTLYDGKWHIEDLGSAGGTYVNGVRITTVRTLHRDDEIRVGKRRLIVVRGDGRAVQK